jgi:mRNA interferase MazF
MNPRAGDIWLADLGLAAKTRPVVIVSRNDPQAPRALVIYVPLTTQNRGSRYEVALGKLSFLNESSVANVQGIGSLPLARLERKLGALSPDRKPPREGQAVMENGCSWNLWAEL